jgi:hypothetical protein
MGEAGSGWSYNRRSKHLIWFELALTSTSERKKQECIPQ